MKQQNCEMKLNGYSTLVREAMARTASFAIVLLAMAIFSSIAHAATFHVTTTADNNNNSSPTAGSLRKAIIDANNNPGTDTIDFNISGAGVHTISLTALLPTITDPVVIDGYTQPGASANTLSKDDNAVLLIQLTGTNIFNFTAFEGLAISAGSSTVKGLIINGFKGDPTNATHEGYGIHLTGKGGNVIAGNFIGTNPAGTSSIANYSGIFVEASSNNVIGGNLAAARNVISGNSYGVDIREPGATGTRVHGNFIGTDRHGTVSLGNDTTGVVLSLNTQSLSDVEIGGTSAGDGNVISGNGNGVGFYGAVLGIRIQGNLIGTDVTGQQGIENNNGIWIQTAGGPNIIGGPTASARNIISGNSTGIALVAGDSNVIQGNYIGTDISGQSGLPNLKDGIFAGSSFNQIGGSTFVEGNVISANGKAGIEITKGAKGNFITRNCIGFGSGVSGALANKDGIDIEDGSDNIIGGSAGGGNAIGFNQLAGVRINKGTGNMILGNEIDHNLGLGIDLGPAGVTLNDLNDADTGPNGLQNFPVLTRAARLNNGLTTVSGNLNSTPNTKFHIDLYLAAADPTSYGEGAVYLGGFDLNTDASGNATFNGSWTGVSLGDFITGTATDPAGNTSEFSQVKQATLESPGSLQFSSANFTVNENGGQATITVKRTGGTFGTVVLQYATTAGGTATSADYTPASGFLSWGDFDAADKTFTVPIIDDTLNESNETINLVLSNPTNGATLGSPSAAVLTITDNDSLPGTLQFSSASYSVNENAAQATITVKRIGGSAGAVSLKITPVPGGTAATGSDYTAVAAILNWADGDSADKTLVLPIHDDQLDEPDKTVNIDISSPTNGATLGNPSSAVLTIVDDDPAPKVSIDDVSMAEGNSGTAAFTFTVTLGAVSGQTVNVNYTTADNTALETSDYQAGNGVVTFAPGEISKQVTVLVNGDGQVEANETFVVNLYNLLNASVGKVTGLGTIVNDDSNSPSPTIQFGQATYSVQEDLGAIIVTVTRSGDTSGAAAVDYFTTDGSAAQKTDFEYAAGSLTFAPGETSKTITLLVNEDMYNESSETFGVTLKNPSGAAIGAQGVAMVTITDDLPESIGNPIDDAQSFVHTQYHDFLNREPDLAGLQFWTSQITACGADAKCIDAARVQVSASFFLSIEFQQTAYLLYLMQKESYSTMPKYSTFMRDLQEVSRGVVVKAPGWEQKLADNQQQFADKWINRPEFKAAYDSLSNDDYVNALYKNAGIAPPQAKKDELVAALNIASMNRSAVLLQVADDASFRQQERNGAFVLMEYFGYLRRDPEATPDSDLSGYNFWLNKLNQFGGNYLDAEMVRAFIISSEYRQRFGQ